MEIATSPGYRVYDEIQRYLYIAMDRKTRIIVSLVIGITATILCLYVINPTRSDFVWAPKVARDILSGRDPYAFEVTARNVPYPLPVALFGFPFLWTSDNVACAVFFGISSGLLAYGLSREGAWRLLTFSSYAYYVALRWKQWSPLITAIIFFPSLLFLVLIKPQNALPIVLSRRPTRSGIIIAIVILSLSLFIMPTWPLKWIRMLGPYENIIPIVTLPFGPLLFLALLRWQDHNARLLFLMALMPQRAVYDLVLLWLIPRNFTQIALISSLSWVGRFINPGPAQPWMVYLLYIPCLVIILEPLFSDRSTRQTSFGEATLTQQDGNY
jgi:hypothetical protein